MSDDHDADDDPRWRQVEEALRRHFGTGTFIYLMYASPQRVKIGQAMNVADRLTTVRRDLGRTVIVMGYCEASPRLESALHRIFTDTRLGGEWFTFEPIFWRLATALNRLRKTFL